MESSIFWHKTLCGPSKVNLFSRWFLAWLILRPWRWRWYVPPKRQLTFNRLHSIIFQTKKLFNSLFIFIIFTTSKHCWSGRYTAYIHQYAGQNIVTWWMKEPAVATQRPVNNNYDVVFSMCSALFSMWSVLRLYNQTRQLNPPLNLLHDPALTETFCMYCLNDT
jgi:hypothetical protein